MTTIRYFIPEDGDNEFQPNIFLAPKSRQQGYPPTLGQIKQSFPLLGRYHFRFKTSLVPGGSINGDSSKNHLAVWMDCIDDNIPVPVWQSQIIAKITRIGVEEEDDDDDDDEDFRRPTHSTSQPATSASSSSSANVAMGVPVSHQQQQQQQHQQVTRPPVAPSVPAPSFDLFGDGPSVSTTTQNNHHSQQQPHDMSANLFDTAPSASSTTSSSLFDMNYQPSTSTAVHSDFLGMTTAPSPPVSGNYGGYPTTQQPPPQQQSQQQRSMGNNAGPSVFGASNTNSGGGGAFGDLAWK